MTDETTRGFWERWKVPVTVISTVVVTVSALVSIYVVITKDVFGPSPREEAAQRDPAAVASHQVLECLENHGMTRPREFTDDQGETRQSWTKRAIVFRRCDWPPVGATSTDGYTEVPLTIRWVKGKKGADQFDQIDTVTMPCADTRITYALVHMGGRLFGTRAVEQGRVYLATIAPMRPGPRDRVRLVIRPMSIVPFDTPKSIQDEVGRSMDAAWVYHSHHFQVFDAWCAATR